MCKRLDRVPAGVATWWRAVWRRRRWLVPTTVGLAVLACVPYIWLVVSTSEQRAPVGEVRTRPVALILGAGLTPSGRPTPFLARRLDIAVELYQREKVRAILVSGDNSRDAYNETDAMRAYLVEAGVPEVKIAGDYAGFSTWESCLRAREVFGVEAATVVTQSFHLPRAVRLCQAAGIDTQGVGDQSIGDWLATTVYLYAREIPASYKAALDIAITPEPTFLGPKETSVKEALGAPR